MSDFTIPNFNEALDPRWSEAHEAIDKGAASARLLIALCVSTWILLFAGAPGLLRYAFVATSFLCALYLFWKHDLQYVSFTWWLYFLAPCIRRLVDYRVGFDASSLMLAAPLLASAISCLALLKLRHLDVRSLPFVMLMLGVTYGLAVSLLSGTSVAVAVQYFLAWLGPVAFGYLLYIRWPRYAEFRQTVQNTFKWGLLVMGVYGVIQYLYAPGWDRFWMDNLSEKLSSFGTPEPMGIRVFSTMNAPQPFALALVLGLLITFYGRSSLLQKAAWIAGYAGLLLSMARSAWLEWAIALVTLAFLGRSWKLLSTVAASVFFCALLTLAVVNLPMGQAVIERFQTLQNVEKDGSGQDRLASYENFLSSSLSSPIGEGWEIETRDNNAMPIHDSTSVEVTVCTGWFGFLMFYGALLFAMFTIFRYVGSGIDQFIPIAFALLLAFLVETLFNSLMGGSSQLGLMTIIGLGLAATHNADSQSANHLALSTPVQS